MTPGGAGPDRATGLGVLILGGGMHMPLAVIRALRAAGAKAVLGVSTPAGAAAATSRLCHASLRHPPVEDPVGLRDFLLAHLRQAPVDVVLPIDDAILLHLAPWRAELERLAPWAAAPAEGTAIALDKRLTAQHVAGVAAGLRPPATATPERAADLATAWPGPFPAVVKPRTGTGAVGIRRADDPAELAHAYAEIDAAHPQPLVQELIPYDRGDKYNLFYLFDGRGDLRSWWMQRTWLEQHSIRRATDGSRVPGGINLMWESVLDRDALERGRRVLEALGWRGFGFVECVRDRRSGEMRLIEINPRFGGAMALALQQGVNFAHDACLVALGRRPPERLDYPLGARGKRDPLTMLAARQPRALLGLLDPRYAPTVPPRLYPGALLREGLRLIRKRVPVGGATAARGRG